MANQRVSEENRSPALKNYYKDRQKQLDQQAEYRTRRDKEKHNAYQRGWRKKLKEEVHAAYGNQCSCCGEATKEFLSIDHIEGRGRHPFRPGQPHRVDTFKTTIQFYAWLKKNNFPKDDYRLLCMNCNFSIGMWGYCPHNQTGGIQ